MVTTGPKFNTQRKVPNTRKAKSRLPAAKTLSLCQADTVALRSAGMELRQSEERAGNTQTNDCASQMRHQQIPNSSTVLGTEPPFGQACFWLEHACPRIP